MRKHNIPRHQRRIILAIIVLATLAVVATDARQERPTGQGFTFRTAVEQSGLSLLPLVDRVPPRK